MRGVSAADEGAGTGRSGAIMVDVAERAGVSKQTVSRVFNNSSNVRPETRQKVLAAAAELGYQPNHSARALTTGRTRTLGVITSDAVSYGPAATLHAISGAARDRGYFVTAIPLSALTRAAVTDAVLRLIGQSVDGIIVIASRTPVARALADASHKVPLVMLDMSFDESVPVVTVDEEQVARQAVDYLLHLGHRTVRHIAGPPDSIAAEGRAAGWRSALRAAGAPEPRVLVGDWSATSGYVLGRELAADPDVTAVFAANDQMAMGVLRAMHEAGRPVPEQVSVVGTDDIPESSHTIPPLSTVRHDFAEIGRRCLALMLDQLESAPRPWARSTVQSELVVRRSSGPPPAR
ncbi:MULTISPECIES: LacI family DNA-binding transcriptional regulator [unclassified Streptomyces]|uniref:LacI family DNA-binding transcriptional regulator n=1 Tax=unclassified Streptomyces TaxID=2593676 RepID=UPI00344C0DC4